MTSRLPLRALVPKFPLHQALLVLVIGAACSPYPSAADSSKVSAATVRSRILTDALDSVAHPCLRHSPRTSEDREISPARVFVESVLVELPVEAQLPASADSLTSISSIQGARLVASPHVVAQLDTTTTAKIERVLPPGATPEPGIFWTGTTVLPRLAEPGLVLEVDLEVQTAEPKKGLPGSDVHQGTHLHNVFAARERQTVMLNAPVPGYARGTLLITVTPYLIRSQRDLRDIFECKMQLRAAQRAAAAQ